MDQVLNRKHSIVYFSDIVGYTLLMGQDEDHAFELMKQNLVLHSEVFEKHGGKIIKELGDGILAIFENAEEALEASLEIHKEWSKSSELELRIGLHCGGIILDHGDVYGDAVNIASRIQSIGVPSCVLFSSDVLANLPEQNKFTHVNLGLFRLKNVAKELELHALTNPPLATPKRADMIKKVKIQEREPWKFWVALASTLTILLFLIYSLLWNNYTWEKEKSVAVLPFTNVDPRTPEDVFSKDITQEIISQVSEINDIKVISYQSIENITNPNLDLDSLAKKLEVTTILKGSIQYLGDNTKVNVQLIDVEENKNLWTDSFSRTGENLLQIQSVIAKEISRVLGISLSAREEAEIGKVLTSSPDAYEWFLKAKEQYSQYKLENFEMAADYYKKAIEIDPNFTMAYAGLADTYAQYPAFGKDKSWYDSSFAVSEIGLQIEPNSAELYKNRGNLYYYLGQIRNAKRSFEAAISIKPNYSEAIGNLATINFSQGNLEKALIGQIKSASLNPLNPISFQMAGWTYKILGNFTEAKKWLMKAINVSNDPSSFSLLASVYIDENNINEAKKLIAQTLTGSPNYANYESAGFISFFSKDFDNAKIFYEKSINSYDHFYNDHYYIVPINYSFLLLRDGENQAADSLLTNAISIREKALKNGEEDNNIMIELASAMAVKKQNLRALEYLQKAYDLGWRDLFFVEDNPIFFHLKGDSTYNKIISQVKSAIERENTSLKAATLDRTR
ncbi:tetratricopeptide repeat protein [Algoriphagus halophilus]|uniref:adenylate/guanylate cyclase domain-containing protein n=1 Tax=Algoriphagus halophilus TaxID=226505 RepID=UPI00358F8505